MRRSLERTGLVARRMQENVADLARQVEGHSREIERIGTSVVCLSLLYCFIFIRFFMHFHVSLTFRCQ